MPPTKHARNAAISSLLAAGILTGGLAMPAIAQDTTPTPATTPTVQAEQNATIKEMHATLTAPNAMHGFLLHNEDGVWQNTDESESMLDAKQTTITATATFADGTTKDYPLSFVSEKPSDEIPLGTTQHKVMIFEGDADGTPMRVTVDCYDAQPLYLNGISPQRPMLDKTDGVYKLTSETVYKLVKNADGTYTAQLNGQPASSLELYKDSDRLSTIPIQWDDDVTHETINGVAQLKLNGTATGEYNGQKYTVNLYATMLDPDVQAATWTTTMPDGTTVKYWWETQRFYGQKLDAQLDTLPTTLDAVSSDGQTVHLTQQKYDTDNFETTPTDKLGVSIVKGNVAYVADATADHPELYLSVYTTDTRGSEVTVKDGPAFTKNDDGTFTTTDTNYTLDGKNQPSADVVTLSNGQTASITWDKDVQTIEKDIDGTATKFIRLNGVATGSVGSQKFTVNITADRAYDTHVTLSVTQTPAEGDPTRIEVPNATNVNAPDLKDTYTLKALPHDKVGDQYTLNVDAANQMDVTVGDTTATIGNNGERHLTTAVTYTDDDGDQQTRTVTVVIPFDKAKPVVGNPDAALDGFLVNGKPMDGFDPDQLDYTITAKADEKVTVKPVAREGQTVKASDIRQTAWTTVQEWTVEKNGQTRVYTVTLVREHSPEQATADDKFTPADPIAQPSTVNPDSADDTQLADHGYVLDGKYHAVAEDDYTIPEGGVFSYGAKIGQTVKVGVEKAGGMTYTYTVGVLAADQKTYGAHTYKVTYLTAATHKAELTGINVDGDPIDGFDPAKHEYTVEVKNPEKWTVTPLFDKSTGMSVSTHKDGDKAVITVSSADNLNTVTYTVTVKQKMKLLDKLGLANTGTTALTAIIAAVVLIAGGAVAGFLSRRRRKPKAGTHAADTATAEPAETTGDDEARKTESDTADDTARKDDAD